MTEEETRALYDEIDYIMPHVKDASVEQELKDIKLQIGRMLSKDAVKMYFITVMEKDGSTVDKYGIWDCGSVRTWGFYKDKDHAIEALHTNVTDMWETCYNFAVLEEIEEGICGYCGKENRIFFKYDIEKNGYYETDEPNSFSGICNIAIG